MYRPGQLVMLRIAIYADSAGRARAARRPVRQRPPGPGQRVSARGPRPGCRKAGRTLADLLHGAWRSSGPGAEAGGLTGRMETHRVRGLRCIGQLARMRGGALRRKPADFRYWPGFTKG